MKIWRGRDKNSIVGNHNMLVQSIVDVLTHVLEENIYHAQRFSNEDGVSIKE